MSKEIFYVALESPSEIRKNVLESSKQIIQNLQRFERIQQIRTEKIKELEKFKKIIKQVNSLNENLNSALPKTGMRKKGVREPAKKEEKSGSEMDKLQEELSSIEKKLSEIK